MSFVDKVNSQMTHVVLPAGFCYLLWKIYRKTHLYLDKHNIVDRSLTYYLGVLYGCYVVNEQCKSYKICIYRKYIKWACVLIGLENSIKKGYPISESRYEISGDKEMGRTGAPEKARKNKESKVTKIRILELRLIFSPDRNLIYSKDLNYV